MTQPKRVFSATRSSGKLQLGNYLGAVKGYIELQEKPEYQCIYMGVDLHTITTPYDTRALAQSTYEVILDYLSAGLDPQKAIITVQSLVPEHTYLAFLFSSLVSIARMQHLPTFKDKVKQYPKNVTMALLNYPVLMAADILAYKAELVPVGVDQEPHLEIAREIARKLNIEYGLTFPEPRRFATPGEYIPSLTGEGKMSKSVEGSSIFLTDSLDAICEKLAKVPTDSGKGDRVPTTGGVATLLTLIGLFGGAERKDALEKQYTYEGIRYGQLKDELAELIYKVLEPIQKQRQELSQNPEYVKSVIVEGAQKARAIASEVVKETKQHFGFLEQ